jgi:DNA repair protein RadC
MAIRDWPEDERPREKLLARGPAALSDAELLAILLRIGVKGKSAVDLGRELIQRFGGLNQLFAASEAALSEAPGMGPAKYVQFQAILEIARRVLAEEMKRGDLLSSPQAVRDYLRLYFQKHQREAFVVIFLDTQHRVVAVEELFAGTLHQTFRHRRAERIRPPFDPGVEGCACRGGGASARPFRGRRWRAVFVRRAWLALTGEEFSCDN